MKAVFEHRVPIATTTAEWRVADPGFAHQMEAVAALAHGADVVIASQDDPDGKNDGYADTAGLLVALAPRPVILVPFAKGNWGAPSRIVVAWNRSREAARAV